MSEDSAVQTNGLAGLSLSQALERARLQRGRALALVDGETRLTWDALAERAVRLAGALQRLGLERGGRIAILAYNSHRYIEVYFGVPWAGGIFTPLNVRLAVPEIAAILRDAGAEILIVDEAHAGLVNDLASLAPLRHIVYAGRAGGPEGMLGYEALLAAAPSVDDAGRSGDDVAALFYTSGSTGAPKGVMHTHANILMASMALAAEVGLDDEAVCLISGPLFHVGAAGLCIPVLVAAGAVVLLPRFEAGDVLAAIERERTTVMSLVPTMLRMLVDHPAARERDLSSLKRLMYGASPMPEPLLIEAMGVLPNAVFSHAYGMTETTASCTVLPQKWVMPDHRHAGRAKSVGRALIGLDVAVAGPDGRFLPPGETGEIVVRGPTVMKGYWNRPDQTAQALRSGWLHTGDLGYRDAEGYVFLVDRLKDMIITGGENVYSTEVEEAIYAFPGVAQCAVIGIPDPKWGEAVHAIIVGSPGAVIDPGALLQHCRERIAGYKCPRSIDVRAEPLPLSGANKINKPVLRRPFWEGRESTII